MDPFHYCTSWKSRAGTSYPRTFFKHFSTIFFRKNEESKISILKYSNILYPVFQFQPSISTLWQIPPAYHLIFHVPIWISMCSTKYDHITTCQKVENQVKIVINTRKKNFLCLNDAPLVPIWNGIRCMWNISQRLVK